MTATDPAGDLAGLYSDIEASLTGIFTQMDIAEDEIEKAAKQHPDHGDLLYHAFALLTPTHPLMATEFVYRSHCAELLARAVAGQDTRPGTAAEICCACSEASQVAPMRTSAAGLYARMWARAFPDQPVMLEDQREHYEALEGAEIDRLAAESARRLSRPDRTLKGTTCAGRHHGDDVHYRYAPAQPALF